MKYLKRYNEDIEWEFDDDEEFPINFKVGDTVVISSYKKEYYRTKYPGNDPYKVTSYKKGEIEYFNPLKIIQLGKREDGELIFKVRGKWPWYVAKYWEIVN